MIEESLKHTKLIRALKLFCENNDISFDSFQLRKSGLGVLFLYKGRQVDLSLTSEKRQEMKLTIFVDDKKIKEVEFVNKNELQRVWVDL